MPPLHVPPNASEAREVDAAEAMWVHRAAAVAPDAVARAVSSALAQPADVDVNEVVIRPTRQRCTRPPS